MKYFLLSLLLPLNLIAQTITPIKVQAVVSFYSAIDSCHYKGCLNALGRRPEFKDVACPRSIPLNTMVHIQGEDYICADRTARFVDGRYDIFLGYGEQAHKDAKRMGIFKTYVLIYDPQA